MTSQSPGRYADATSVDEVSGYSRAPVLRATDDGVVTLIVYQWRGVSPGMLAWEFPSVDSALGAAETMRNAVRWAIVLGRRAAAAKVEELRAKGEVLFEQG